MKETPKQADLRILAERQEYISKAEAHLNDMRSHQTAWISFARGSGSTWLEIAQAIGCSPQAAEQRHARWLAQEEAAGTTGAPE
jgi:hypothetical protein